MFLQIPLWYFPIQNTDHDWQFRSEPSDRACRRVKNGCFHPRGKMLGGTHAMNGAVYMRGNKGDYDGWQQMGNSNWNWNNVLKYFKRSEANRNQTVTNYQNGRWHSTGGKLSIDNYHESEKIRNVFIEAAKEYGYAFVHDLNADKLLGYANAQGTLKNGERHSTAKAFLVPAKDRTNLHVIKYAHVTKILINDAKAVSGLEFVYMNDHKLIAMAKKEYILSTGAISTPQLLMLSGIGPKEHLANLGIDVKRSLAVGKNLQDHIIVPLIFQFNEFLAEPESPLQILDDLYNYAIHRKGPLGGIGTINLIGMINTLDHSGFPDIELQHFSQKRRSAQLKTLLHAMDYDESVIEPILKANEDGETTIVYVELLRPKSKGNILLRSNNPYDVPKILPNYLTHDQDIQTLLRGIRYQTNFINSKAFKKNKGKIIRIPFEDCDRHVYMSDEYWVCYMTHMATTVYHPVGTAKMGPSSDVDAVVDSELKVKGIKKLRIVDASIFPTIVSGNTNGAVIMVGEKGADFLKSEWILRTKGEL